MTGRKFYGIVKQNLSEKGEIPVSYTHLQDYAVLGYAVLVDGEVTESGKITDEALLELCLLYTSRTA